MNEKERSQFIERELRGLWPEWNPTDAELRIWSQALAWVPYGLARKAVQALFRKQRANYRRPVLSRFIEQVHVLGGTTSPPRQRRDPTTNVYVECIEPPPDKPHRRGCRKGVYTEKQDDPRHVEAGAELMRDRQEEIYGGRWITVRTPPAPTNEPRAECRVSEVPRRSGASLLRSSQ